MATTVPAPTTSWGMNMFSSTPAAEPVAEPAAAPPPSMLSNVSSAISSLGRTGTKTYCCDSKTSNRKFMSSRNVGKNCKPSATGQCFPGYFGESYKFRCFDVNSDAINDNSERKMITEGRMNENDVKEEIKYNPNTEIITNPGNSTCKYVTGSLAKLGNVAIAPLAVTPFLNPLQKAVRKINIGGKHKRKSKKSNKKSKKTLSKSRKNKRKTKKH